MYSVLTLTWFNLDIIKDVLTFKKKLIMEMLHVTAYLPIKINNNVKVCMYMWFLEYYHKCDSWF